MNKALILIIDGSSETRGMYADYFRHHGYGVAEAADGQEGVRLTAELGPSLVVTELSEQPEWLEAVRSLWRPEAADRPALIACSTLIDPQWPFAPEGVDVDLALPKPTSPRELLMEAQFLLAKRCRRHPSAA